MGMLLNSKPFLAYCICLAIGFTTYAETSLDRALEAYSKKKESHVPNSGIFTTEDSEDHRGSSQWPSVFLDFSVVLCV